MKTTKNSIAWNDAERLRKAASESKTLTEVLTKMGVNHNSGNFQTLKSQALRHGIELPKYNPRNCTQVANLANTLSLEEMFSNRGVKTSSDSLKKKMNAHFGIKNECKECGQGPVWNGKPLTLELDHIDGNSFNNEISNLRILCGHCHSQTLNFRGRGRIEKVYHYCSCGKRINKGSANCNNCSLEKRREVHKINPRYLSIESVYESYLREKTFVALGKFYGVSDNAVRKYIKSHGVSIQDFMQGSLAQK